jgi:hypothetical protein
MIQRWWNALIHIVSWPTQSRIVRHDMQARGNEVDAQAVSIRIRRNTIERALLGEEV